jgi:hypothetical protein
MTDVDDTMGVNFGGSAVQYQETNIVLHIVTEIIMMPINSGSILP